MGWTTYYVIGKIEPKKEMDRLYNWETDKTKCRVLKSRMVGSIYYGAIECVNKLENTRNVIAAVCITSKATGDGMNFGYKSMDESMHPYYYDCPKSILDLLTPTESESSNEWRKKCRERLEEPKLSDVKVGQRIKANFNNKEMILTKMSPNYQFKRNWYYCAESHTYVPTSRIKNWELLIE